MNHALLVEGLVVGELGAVLDERLTQAGDVSVAEDAEERRDQTLLLAVAAAVLELKVPDECLGDRQANVARRPGRPLGAIVDERCVNIR